MEQHKNDKIYHILLELLENDETFELVFLIKFNLSNFSITSNSVLFTLFFFVSLFYL